MRRLYALLLIAAFVVSTAPSMGLATSADRLRLAVDSDSGSSRMAAIGFGSLVRLQDLGFELDTTLVRSGASVLDGLATEGADLAILDAESITDESLLDQSEFRAVMRYWTSDSAQANGSEAQNGGYMLVSDASVPAERIEAFLDAALEDEITLRAVRIDIDRLTPEASLSDFPLAAHDGVVNYLRGKGIEPPDGPDVLAALDEAPEIEPAPWRPQAKPELTVANLVPDRLDEAKSSRPQRSFTLYFDTGEASIDKSGFKSVAAACEFAATLPKARFVISGHADTVGTDASNTVLSSQRAQSVADAIRNDPRFREVLSVVEFGERSLAVATDDNVAEPKNRRVEITVYEE
ncbi:MAG: OmpA family protein [Pseudomonadota bacterium]